MTSFLDRYNLRPQEKRVVIVVGLVLFILVNLWFVVPHFGDWSLLKEDIRQTRRKTKMAQEEIERVKGPAGYEVKLKKLESEGASIQPEEQAIQFQASVDGIARSSGLGAYSITPGADTADTATAKFFTEKSVGITYSSTEEKHLVEFVYRLGSQSSMFRVKDLTMKPSANDQNLEGRMTVVASYLKNLAKPAPAPVSKAATNAVTKGKPVAKPAVKPAPKPATNSTHRPPPPERRTGGQPARPGGPGNKPGGPGAPRSIRPANPASTQ